jgi:hypothetical protein
MNDLNRWQSTINGCLLRQCPWFKSLSLMSNPMQSIDISNNTRRACQLLPSIDHSYAYSSRSFSPDYSRKKTNVFTSTTDSLLHYLDETYSNLDNEFVNLHEIDLRKCQLCETYADHSSTTIGRLISFGINQWVHVGCILPAYAKNLDQPPYILRNIRETVLRCQTKYLCSICSKLGASVHCYENECYQRFHCNCIQKYYASMNKQHQQQLNITNGFLPNLTTLCLKHNQSKIIHKQHRNSADTNTDEQNKDSVMTSR